MAMTAIRFPQVLTLMELERKLRSRRPYTLVAGGWSPEVKRSGLQLDLSGVEYADFTALAQIALLVEGAARHGCRVRLATPLRGLSKAEQSYLAQLEER